MKNSARDKPKNLRRKTKSSRIVIHSLNGTHPRKLLTCSDGKVYGMTYRGQNTAALFSEFGELFGPHPYLSVFIVQLSLLFSCACVARGRRGDGRGPDISSGHPTAGDYPMARTNGSTTVNWSCFPCLVYQLEPCTNLATGNWVGIGTATRILSESSSATDPNSARPDGIAWLNQLPDEKRAGEHGVILRNLAGRSSRCPHAGS